MASDEHVAGRERKVVNDDPMTVILSSEVYNVLRAKAELYDEYIKQSRFYNKTVANKNHEDDDDRK